ncbi:MAG: Ig-like domain-containing protein [Clostridia bacterium]
MNTAFVKRILALFLSVIMTIVIMPTGFADKAQVNIEESIPSITTNATYADVNYDTVLEPGVPVVVTLGAETATPIEDPRTAYAVGFTVNLTPGTTAQLKLVREGAFASVDTFMYLYDENFNLVASNDDYSGSGGLSLIEARVVTGGTFKLLITGYSMSSIGTFAAQFNLLDITYADQLDYSTVVNIGDIFDVTLGEGTSVMTRMPDTRDAYAVGFTIALNAGEYVRLYSPTAYDVCDAYFYILDSEFAILSDGDEALEFTADTAGNYYIIACGYDETNIGTFELQIQAKIDVTGVTCTPTQAELMQGRSLAFHYSVQPENATNKEVVLESDNTAVATISEFGRITAITPGTAQISVRTVDGNFIATCSVTVIPGEAFPADTNQIFAYIFNSDSTSDDYGCGWISFDPADLMNPTVYTSGNEFELMGGEFYDGIVYGYTYNGDFYTVDTTSLVPHLVAAGVTMPNPSAGYSKGLAMAFDYSTSTMYAAIGANKFIYKINIETGEITEDVPVDFPIYGIACSTDGHLYGVSDGADIYEINKTTGELTLKASSDWPIPFYAPFQKLVFDHINQELYWAYFNGNDRFFFHPNFETGVVDNLGTISDEARYMPSCMFTISSGTIIPEITHVESVSINPSSVDVFTGWGKQLRSVIVPANASDQRVIWESSDTSIATVNDRGFVIGVTNGSVIITARSVDGGFEGSSIVNVITPPPYNSPDYLFGYSLYETAESPIGFFAITPDVPSMKHMISEDSIALFAGEFYDETIYGYNDNGEFYTFDFETLTPTYVAESNARTVMDMAFDYSTFTMYALADIGGAGLYTVNLETGYLTLVGALDGVVFTLGCTTEGQLYCINSNGELYSLDKTNAGMTLVGNTGAQVSLIQSMAYDHNAGIMYWANYNRSEGAGTLMTVNLETGAATAIGKIGVGTECTALFSYPMNPPAPIIVPVTGITVNPTELTMMTNEYSKLTVNILPENASSKNVTFTSSDENILKVTNGTMHAISVGTAVVTVTTVDGNFSAECFVTVEPRPEIENDGLLRGHLFSDGLFSGGFYATIDPEDPSGGFTLITGQRDVSISAVLYQDIIYAYTRSGYFYTMNADMSNPVMIGYSRTTPWDMAYDHTSGKLYGITNYQLLTIDVESGATTVIGTTTEKMFAMTFDDEGTLYVVTEDGWLCTVDKTIGELTHLFSTGNGATYAQSMTYDFVNQCIYWAQIGDSGTGSLLRIDPITQEVVAKGTIGDSYQITGLMSYSRPTQDYDIGDINMSGEANTGDVSTILKYCIGLADLTKQQLKIGDINHDGNVNSGDAAILLLMILDDLS